VVRDHDAGDARRASGTEPFVGILHCEAARRRLAERLTGPEKSIRRRLVALVVLAADDNPKEAEKSEAPQHPSNRVPAGARRARERPPFDEIAKRLGDTGKQTGLGLEDLSKEAVLSPLQLAYVQSRNPLCAILETEAAVAEAIRVDL